MNLFKKSYIFALTLIFFYYLVQSYLDVLQEHTTFEESIDRGQILLPSITFCPRQWDPDNFTTFEQIMDKIQRIKCQSEAYLRYIGKGISSQALPIDLLDEKEVAKFNKSLDEMWSYGAMIQPDRQYALILCTTLNLHFIQTRPKFGSIQIKLNLNHEIISQDAHKISPGFYVEKHEYQQSWHNYDFDRLKNFEIVHPQRGNTIIAIPTQTKSLKKSNYDCFENNSMKFTHCVNDFLVEELNCSLPWTKRNSKEIEVCQGSEKLRQFRNLSFHISSADDLRAKIQAKGCFTPNCISTKWTKIYDEHYALQESNVSTIQIGVPDTSYSIIRKEILLADFSTFVANCGSYLGLFLGLSVLSLTDHFFGLIQRIKKWCVSK